MPIKKDLGIINALDFGAKGDGTTDDILKIQSAIDAASASGLKQVYLPDATYLVSDVINIPVGVSLKGAGKGTVLKGNTLGKEVIKVTGGKCSISSLTIDGNTKSLHGIILNDNAVDIKIEDVEIKNVYGGTTGAYGINIKNGCSNVLVDFCKITDVTGVEDGTAGNSLGANRAILVGKVTRTTISNSIFERIAGFEDGDCIQVQTSLVNSKWEVSDVTIINCTFPSVYKRAIKFQASNCRAINNTITSSFVGEGLDCPHAGISVYGDNCRLISNDVNLPRSAHGLEILGSYHTITGNNVLVDIAGLYASARSGSTQSAIYLTDASSINISNNNLGCKSRAIYCYTGANEINIVNNMFRGETQYPIIITGASNIAVLDNKLSGVDDDDPLIPYQGVSVTNSTGVVQIAGNRFFRTQIAIRLTGDIEEVQVFNNMFFDVAERVRIVDLNAGQDINLTIGEGQLNRLIQLDALPTIGVWRRGDIIINKSPSALGYRGWECLTSGSFISSTAWAATTAYTLNTYVTGASGRLYKCVVAGTSAGTAPSHTYGKQVDGTVTWLYIGIAADPTFKPFGKLVEAKTGLFTTSGNGSTKAFSIPHGITTTTTVWGLVQASSADAGTAEIDYVTTTTTNIVVNFKTAPVAGTNNVLLRWKAEI